MSTITTRSGKGSPLTNNEVDANFNNLNTDKLESGDLSVVTTEVGTAALAYNSGVFTYTPPDLTDIDLSLYAPLAGATFTGDVEAPEFVGSLRGNNIFKAKAGEALSKGDAVYISGISGNTPVVNLADADVAGEMPAFGVASADASLNSTVDVVTYGAIKGLDTSGFALGDTLYVGTTPGGLVNTAPSGETSLVQNIGKVERVHASAGILFIAGAGRTNATPNLNDGNFFLGNSSNQAVSADFTTAVLGEISAGTGIGLSGGVISNTAPDQTVALTGAGATSISGTYPNFTITSTDTVYTHPSAHSISFITGLQTALDGKVDDSQVLTNVPANALFTDTVYTLPAGYATETYVGNQITALVDSSPAALDTLNELAAALGDDPNFATTVTNSIATKLPLSGGTLTGELKVNAPVTIKNPVGTGRVEIGTIANDQQNGYVRGSIIMSRNEDQITYNTTSDLWVHAGGASTDWSMISHTTAGTNFYTGPTVSAETTYTNTAFDTAYRWLSVSTSSHVATFKSRPKVGTNNIWHSGDFANNSANWNTAYGWGNHASAGYLTSYTDTNTTYSAGTGITLTGTEFSLTDTNAKLNLSGGTLTGTTTFTDSIEMAYSVGNTFNLLCNNTGFQTLNIASNNLDAGVDKYIYIGKNTGSNAGNSTIIELGDDAAGSLVKTFSNFQAIGTVTATGGNSTNWNTAYGWGNHASAGYVTANTTYSAGTGITLSGTTFSLTDTNAKLNLSGGTMTGELQLNARLDIGSGTQNDAEIRIYKADNNISDHIQFYNGTTRVGEIGCHDTTWLRINQSTAKNIYTPRYIRADSGFFVDDTTKGINGSGNFIGGTITGASDANVSNWDTAYGWGNHAGNYLPLSGGTLTGALTTANSLKVTGIASSNSSPAVDQVELSGYGLIGNRSNLYITNSNASGQIVMGISGAHNANAKLTVTTSGITVGGTVSATGGNSTNWNTAYGWGNHASAGYTSNVGDITGVTVGTGLDGGGTSGTVNITLDLSEFTDMTAAVVGTQDELILLDNGAERRKLISEITLSDFNNDSGWTSNVGDITGVTAGTGLTGGGTSGTVTLNVDSTVIRQGQTYALGNVTRFKSNDVLDTASGNQAALEVFQDTNGADAFMAFHVNGDYAAYFGLHGGINDFVVGGWSKGAGYQRVFHDAYHPNADKWTTARTLTLGGDVTGSVSWDGSANATLTTVVNNDSHYHSQVYIPDTRGAQRAPSYYPDKYVSFDFQSNADTLAGGDSWNVLQTVAPWSVYDASHRQQQLAWTGSGGLKFRYATSESAWAGWQTLWTSGNDGSNSGLDADKLDGQHGSYYYAASNPNGYTSNVGDITGVTAGTGLTGGGASGAVTLNVIGGSGITANANDIAVDSTVIRTTGTQTIGGAKTFSDATIYMAGNLAHSGDTNTYMGFHAADQWRVVTGGTERLEVNNSAVTIPGTLNVRGAIDLADNDILRLGSGDDVEFFCDGTHMYMDLNSGIGNFYIRDGTTTRYTFNDNGNFTATGNISAYSDIRLKEDIKPIEDAVSKVQQLTGNTYTRNDLKDPDRRYGGVIAQEVEVVLPEAVSESEDGTKTVDYNAMIALLIESIKELKAEVDDLKAQLEAK